ncbi:MAG: MFS transporter, partial [Saccharothrix sp.]|nr:MFS transporter [Saccharothrix sp.]
VVAGPLGTRFGTETTLLAGAVVLALVTCAALCSRQVRGLVRRAPVEATG